MIKMGKRTHTLDRGRLEKSVMDTSKLCKNYLGKSAGILSVMEWPAQSPDLNPIELLWEPLDRMVRKKCPSSQSNLWEVLQEAWGEISSDYLNKLTARRRSARL